jgi:hypothetical protein
MSFIKNSSKGSGSETNQTGLQSWQLLEHSNNQAANKLHIANRTVFHY